jgi:hypothetical protein
VMLHQFVLGSFRCKRRRRTVLTNGGIDYAA